MSDSLTQQILTRRRELQVLEAYGRLRRWSLSLGSYPHRANILRVGYRVVNGRLVLNDRPSPALVAQLRVALRNASYSGRTNNLYTPLEDLNHWLRVMYNIGVRVPMANPYRRSNNRR